MDDELEDVLNAYCCREASPEPPFRKPLGPVVLQDPSTDPVEDCIEILISKVPPVVECSVPTRSIEPRDLIPYNPPVTGHLSDRELFVNISNQLLLRGPFSFVDLPDNFFEGEGVYAIYCHDKLLIYEPLWSPAATCPLYIGKHGALNPATNSRGHSLAERLGEHYNSIQQTGLGLENFTFRFLLLPNVVVGVAEQVLHNHWDPLWNKSLRGFGYRSRTDARMNTTSAWDVLHPGRSCIRNATACRQTRAQEDVEEAVRAAIPNHLRAYHTAMAILSAREIGPG